MPRHLLVSLTALAALALGGLPGAAYAQANPPVHPQHGHAVPFPVHPAGPANHGNVVGAGVGNANQGGIRTPRFIVQAVNFTALDESGRDVPFTSDEVIVKFADGADWDTARHTMVTHEFTDVDTGESRDFPYDESCIVSIPEPTNVYHNTWLCDPHGVEAPLAFTIIMREGDTPDFFGFCVPGRTTYGPGSEDECNADTLFDHAFTYQLSEIMPRVANACRCFTETADARADSRTHYQITFKITRVDEDGGPLTLDPGSGGAGPTGPTVLSTGTLTAHSGQEFELDAGAVGNNGDFAFDHRLGAMFELDAPGSNGAKIWLGGTTPRGYAACAAAQGSSNYVSSAVTVPANGNYACYVTDNGHVGEFRFDNLNVGAQTLTITYTTWQ